MPFKTPGHRLGLAFIGFILIVTLVSCQDNSSQRIQTRKETIPFIKNKEQFKKITKSVGNRLMMVEFYADWCPPCKELAPILEEIAHEKSGTVNVYKINTDQNPGLASAFRVTGIPHVVFIKNRESVFTLSGLYPKAMYLKIIGRFSQAFTDQKPGVSKEAT